MKYINAAEVLPESLIKQIQEYISGDLLYIPQGTLSEKKKWGEKSGSRQYYAMRNSEIKSHYKQGKSIMELAEAYGLSFETVKKILYSKGLY